MADLKRLKEGFDLKRYLEDMDIPYATGGDNVSAGWVGVACPFCNDHANHLGISIEKKNTSCWICGTTGDIINYIMEVEEISFGRAKERLDDYQEGLTLREVPEVRERRRRGPLLPKNFRLIEKGKEPPLVRAYFERRGFPLEWCQEFGLGFVPNGEHQLRLIVPVTLDGEVVSFQAMDMTGKASIPYEDCPKDRALVYNKHNIYGLDDIKGDQVVVVEGVTDRWRMGKEVSVAMFGKKYTQEQMNRFSAQLPDITVKVLFDVDAKKEGMALAKQLSARFSRVRLLGLDSGDPAELSREEVERVLEL